MKLKLSICFLSFLLFTPTTQALQTAGDPYVGLSVMQTSQTFTSDYAAKKLFTKNPQEYSVKMGVKFYSNLGLELGYNTQPKKTKQHFFLPGQIDQAYAVVQNNETVSAESEYSSRYPYIGITASTNSTLTFCANPIKTELMLGLAFIRISATSKINDISAVSEIQINRTYNQHKRVPIARASVIADLSNILALDLFCEYKNMHRFKITSKETTPSFPYRLHMKNALGVGVGLRLFIGR